jgi:hypothetical protein
MRSLARGFLWAGVLSCLLTVRVPAAPMQVMSLESMTADAALIVAGRVAGFSSQWNSDHTQIITTVRIIVSDVLKGNFAEPELSLRMLGGVIPEENISMDIVEAPTFAVNDDVVLMLKKNFASGLPFVGDVQGAFVTQSDGNAANAAGLSLPRGELRSRIIAAAQNSAPRELDPRFVPAIHAKAAGR